jgi:hypothetical protein
MAILKGATFSKTFADGFREGYRARMGNDAGIPAIPAHSIAAGVGAYLWGVAMGIVAALKEKPVREAPPD